MSVDFRGNMNAAEKFTRTVFGVLLVASFFFSWGKWIVLMLGVLFLMSVATGWCSTCWAYNKLFGRKECVIHPEHKNEHG